MSLALFVSPKWSFQDDTGGNASGWKLYTYEPGTSTPKAAYQDSAGTTPHANPIVLDARGEAEIWLDGAYKFILKNAAGVTKWTADDITGYGAGVQTGYLTKSVAGSANVALTASEQSNAVIEFTGELTGNINVTVGDDKDGYRWTLINNTTGSFTLTFKTTSGTGPVIPQGAEAHVYHDGTDIVHDTDAQLGGLGGSTVGKGVFTAADAPAARSAVKVANISANGVLCPHQNLVIQNNATNPTYQVDIDADALVLTDSSGNQVLAESVNLTVDLTASGANGLDTGGEATSTWYHLWVISNGTTTAGLLSTSATAPTMPAGYTFKGYVGSIYNGSGGDLTATVQYDTAAKIVTTAALTGGTATTRTAVSLGALVPPTAKEVAISVNISATDSLASQCIVWSFGADNGVSRVQISNPGGNNNSLRCSATLLVASQTIYYAVTTNDTTNILVEGWRY